MNEKWGNEKSKWEDENVELGVPACALTATPVK